MDNICKLTIAVITMNRCTQLIEALDSCIACQLPVNSEFIILDNASSDGTVGAISKYIELHPQVQLNYYYSSENLGVGGGRSFVFNKANGQYVYFLDDDAIIAAEYRTTFFIKSISFLDKHPQVASLTTQIYDEIFGVGRTQIASKKYDVDGLPMMYFFLGGSHFLRKDCFSKPLYFNITYGSEEYAPSIQAIDQGYVHVLDKSIGIIHKPKINKWADTSTHKREILIRSVAVVYATKRLLYPSVFYPILWVGYTKRKQMYLADYPSATKEADIMVQQIVRDNPCKKIRVSTVVNMYRKFGMTVF